MLFKFLLILCFWCFAYIPTVNCFKLADGVESTNIYLSISAINRKIEVNWFNGNADRENAILLTNKPINEIILEEYNFTYNGNVYYNKRWKLDDETAEILFEKQIDSMDARVVTEIAFDTRLWEDLDYKSSCYGYWFYHVNKDGKILSNGCLRSYPTWMNDMRDKIGRLKFRDLFIPGTHDSASYKRNFDPANDTLVTKYSLTQDDDIRTQLINGIRYLDIRVGYYRSDRDKFWANHGISKMQPLKLILEQVKDFVENTNEILILDFQEFPVGFRKDLNIHRQLVTYLHGEIGDYAVHYSKNGWQVPLNEIWSEGKNIIIGYDHVPIANEFDDLWQSVQQRWGDVQTLDNLVAFLKNSRKKAEREFAIAYRPFAEMSELTPKTLDVLTDKHKGLRRMADKVNFEITKLYYNELGAKANIVAVDFYMSTNIIETAIYWNKKK